MHKTVNQTAMSGLSSQKDGPVTETTKEVEVPVEVEAPTKPVVHTLFAMNGDLHLVATNVYFDQIQGPPTLPDTFREFVEKLSELNDNLAIEVLPMNIIELQNVSLETPPVLEPTETEPPTAPDAVETANVEAAASAEVPPSPEAQPETEGQ